VVVYNCSVYL